MKLQNLAYTVQHVMMVLEHLEKDPLHTSFKRDLFAILNRSLNDDNPLSPEDLEQIIQVIAIEKTYLKQLTDIYSHQDSNSMNHGLSHAQQKELDSVFESRSLESSDAFNMLSAAPTMLNYYWIRLANDYSRFLNKSSLLLLRPISPVSRPVVMNPIFMASIKERILMLIKQHLDSPLKTHEDHLGWTETVDRWFCDILNNLEYSNQDLSSLYWTNTGIVFFINHIFPLRSRSSSTPESRTKGVHALTYWFCQVLDGYQDIKKIYKLYQPQLSNDLLLLRDSKATVYDDTDNKQWVDLARFLIKNKLRPDVLPISFSTHQAIWQLVSQAFRIKEFYETSSEQLQESVINTMSENFWSFYHNVYMQLPLDEKKRLDEHLIMRRVFYTTFGSVIQDAIGSRYRFLHVLNELPQDTRGMETDYIFTGSQLYYVNYITRDIEPVVLTELNIFLRGLASLKKVPLKDSPLEYKVYLDDASLKTYISDNGSHVPQDIEQVCMNTILKGFLPLLIDYDPFTLFPDSIEEHIDSSDYFDYKEAEPEDLWQGKSPFLLERLRYHSLKKVYNDFDVLDRLTASVYISKMVHLIMTFRFIDTSSNLMVTGFSGISKGPELVAELLSWIGMMLSEKVDPRFIAAYLFQKKLAILKDDISSLDVSWDHWDRIFFICTAGYNLHSYIIRLDQKKNALAFINTALDIKLYAPYKSKKTRLEQHILDLMSPALKTKNDAPLRPPVSSLIQCGTGRFFDHSFPEKVTIPLAGSPDSIHSLGLKP